MTWQRLRFRPHPRPSLSLPLCVRSTGHYRVAAGWTEANAPRPFSQVFWGVAGSGRFFRNNRWQTLRDGELFLYQPNEPHRLEAGSAGWEYRWLTFDGLSDVLLRLLRLGGWRKSGPCPERLFAAVERCLREPTARGEQRASVLAYEILLAATNFSPVLSAPRAACVRRVQEVLDEGFRDPRFDVSALASLIGVHRSTLFRLFVQHYGVSPAQYLSRMRLALALELLRDTSLTIQEIGDRVGIVDPAYLSRLVRQATGRSPRGFRNEGGGALRPEIFRLRPQPKKT